MTESSTQSRRLGYARVSTYGQTLNTQLEQLRAVGCTKIYREKVTGARAYGRMRVTQARWNGHASPRFPLVGASAMAAPRTATLPQTRL
jgi:hypothetical protein